VTETTFDQLLSAEGQRAIAAATERQPTESNSLQIITALRKHFPTELARAAFETVLLRERAKSKFSRAAEMYFTREALEVASSEVVSRYRARRYSPWETVGDFCCGLGGDAIGLSLEGRTVEAVDCDPLRLRFVEANAAAYGMSARVRVHRADILQDRLPEVLAAFADPGRRSGDRRFLQLADYLPPPDAIRDRFPADFPLAFKLAPGVSWTDLKPWSGEVEFIAANGELKEAVLWLGPLRTIARRATILPEMLSLTADRDLLAGEPQPLGEYLYDPNSALVRAGLVPLLAEKLEAAPVDWTVQMLTSNRGVATPWATVYRVQAVLKWDARQVGIWLKAQGIGRVTPVHRGAPPDAEVAVRRWKLSGGQHAFTVLTRLQGQPVAIVAEREGETV
jgi:hypothetical protein